MSPQATVSANHRQTLGLVLIAIGVALTLDHVGIMHLGGIARWWPLFLLGVGTVKLRQPLEDGQRATGIALIFLGSLLLVGTILSLAKGWPLLLVAAGGLLIFQAFEKPRDKSAEEIAHDVQSAFLSDIALIGHLKRTVITPDFKGGSVTAVMGGVHLDLRKATIVQSPAFLDVAAIWGGIELRIPPEWSVQSEVVPVMGGFDNKVRPLSVSGTAPRLIVRGCAVMGAVVISD
jgi:predicted membrane protein